MLITKWLLAATVAAGLATGASAATLSGDSSGVFTGENGDNASFAGNVLTWPTDGDDDKSTLTIDNFNFSEPVPIGVSQVQVGQLIWFNASSPASVTPDEFTATGDIELNFTSPSGAVGTQMASFTIENTANPEGDLITAMALDGFDFDFTLPLDLGSGVSVTGFTADLVGLSPGTFANGLWSNPENTTSTLGIYANIAAVPLPAAGWLLLAGLGGLAAVRRRRKAA